MGEDTISGTIGNLSGGEGGLSQIFKTIETSTNSETIPVVKIENAVTATGKNGLSLTLPSPSQITVKEKTKTLTIPLPSEAEKYSESNIEMPELALAVPNISGTGSGAIANIVNISAPITAQQPNKTHGIIPDSEVYSIHFQSATKALKMYQLTAQMEIDVSPLTFTQSLPYRDYFTKAQPVSPPLPPLPPTLPPAAVSASMLRLLRKKMWQVKWLNARIPKIRFPRVRI